MIAIIGYGKVQDGNLKIVNKDMFLSDLAMFEGKEVTIRVEKKTKKRTLSQNAYMHLMFTIFKNKLNELGNTFTMENVKEMMKVKFLLVDEHNVETGELIGQWVKDTSQLTTTEMTVFIDEVIQYAAETFHIELPYPNEQLRFELV